MSMGPVSKHQVTQIRIFVTPQETEEMYHSVVALTVLNQTVSDRAEGEDLYGNIGPPDYVSYVSPSNYDVQCTLYFALTRYWLNIRNHRLLTNRTKD